MTSEFFTNEKADFHELSFITVKSNALKKRADITVYEPKTSVDANNLPIVILLHGVYGSHWAWAVNGNVHKTLEKLIGEKKCDPMLLVMPSDGLYGDGSGYLPHKTEDFEQWIVEDVIQAVKEHFPSVSDHSPVFIAGLSMGGFGAIRLGAKYPKIFTAFSGLSSITHFNQFKNFVADFSRLKCDAVEQDGVSDWLLKNKTLLPPFRFDCGKDDALIEANRELHRHLKLHEIPHDYFEFEGGHTWQYWEENIGETLMFFNRLAN